VGRERTEPESLNTSERSTQDEGKKKTSKAGTPSLSGGYEFMCTMRKGPHHRKIQSNSGETK